MGFMGRTSQLKSKTIKKVWMNKKDYKFLDFDFKVTDINNNSYSKYNFDYEFNISVYNCKVLILKLNVNETKEKVNERFFFTVTYFNPQTDNDCYSINHILAVCSEDTVPHLKHKDRGNAEVIKNQFIYRKKKSYYSYVKIWVRGEIKEDNYNKLLSYEFATDEYLSYIKHIFEVKKMQRRKIKKHFKGFLDKMILLDKLTN